MNLLDMMVCEILTLNIDIKVRVKYGKISTLLLLAMIVFLDNKLKI